MQTTSMSRTDAPAAPPAAPLQFSAAALERLRTLLADEGGGARLRVYVEGGGCSGLQYGFAFDDQTDADDLSIDDDGVGIVVDSMSLQYLAGASVDFEDGLAGARFVVRNPNAATSCGCGSSFSV